jgi:DNA-directed RNA polymerase I subunit RPA1
MQGTFFEKSEVNQLIYSSLRTLIENDTQMKRIELVRPAILRPRKMWTGKQVVSTIIRIIAERDEVDQQKLVKFMKTYEKFDGKNDDGSTPSEPVIQTEQLYMSGKTRINEFYLSDINKMDKQVRVQGNELVTGILDKNNIGATSFGLIHCFYELTDSKRTGRLLSGLSRLFCNYLQMHGFTCSLEDLFMTPEFEELRKNLIDKAFKDSSENLAQKLNVEDFKYEKKWKMFNRPKFEMSPADRLKNLMKKKPMKDYLAKNNQLSWAIGRKIVCQGKINLNFPQKKPNFFQRTDSLKLTAS